MKIYTRTGDGGETSLFDGTRVAKNDPRVEAYGAVDETNAWLGLARATGLDTPLAEELLGLQRDLFAVGAQLADPADKIAARVTKAVVTDADVERLEADNAPLGAVVIRYVNRLSDLLFVMARLANHRGGVPDVEW